MRKPKASLIAALSLALSMVLVVVSPVLGKAKAIRFIRDAEVENIIRAYATPLFHAAGLNPKAIDVYLVDDPHLNAFVTPGLNMFIHTGLLMRTDDPLQLIGVIAHETGHLAGGHTATRGENLRRSTRGVMASYALGLAAAIATGRPEIASAVIAGGQDIALKGLLNYTRSQEAAADQAAIRLLNGTGQSPRGLLEFLRIMSGQEVLLRANQDPYLRSHPLTRDRVAFLEDQVRISPYAAAPANPRFVMLHARMRAKLVGFLQPMERVLQRYPESDHSLPARYARAIASYRKSDLATALELTASLIADHPDDPYFRELKGQMLFENGRIAEALPAYEAAVRRLPESPQLRLGLAQVMIEMNDPALDRKVLGHLAETLRHEPGNSFAWRLSAIAHGRRGDVGLTALALAEGALARGKPGEARNQAVRAQKILAENSAGWLRAADIEKTATRMIRRR
ncbi:MAG: M48 family metallopeptidase [Proteobacteria bacterium]|nr:M48 family metallopeptidase [Pseudomonadota bacterium]